MGVPIETPPSLREKKMRNLILILVLSACTENEMAKNFGGKMKVDLPCGQKLTMITWKDSDLWYATRHFRPDDVPETTTFQADTSYGMMEGSVIVTEKRCSS